MAKGKSAWVLTALSVVAVGLSVGVALLVRSVWAFLPAIGVLAFDNYAFSVKVARKGRMQYPMVPPEGKPGWYLPTTDIPRPAIEDFRKMEKKKRRFARANRMVRRAMKPKRK